MRERGIEWESREEEGRVAGLVGGGVVWRVVPHPRPALCTPPGTLCEVCLQRGELAQRHRRAALQSAGRRAETNTGIPRRFPVPLPTTPAMLPRSPTTPQSLGQTKLTLMAVSTALATSPGFDCHCSVECGCVGRCVQKEPSDPSNGAETRASGSTAAQRAQASASDPFRSQAPAARSSGQRP